MKTSDTSPPQDRSLPDRRHHLPGALRAMAILIRTTGRPLGAGFAAGFFLIAPSLWGIALFFTLNPDSIPVAFLSKVAALSPDRSVRFGCESEIDPRNPDWLFGPELQHCGTIHPSLLMGSSEMGHPGSPHSVMGRLRLLSAFHEIASPLFLGNGGSGILRAAITLRRLRTMGIFPRKLYIVVNPHYAAAGNSISENSYYALFPDRPAMLLFHCSASSKREEELPGPYGNCTLEKWDRFLLALETTGNLMRDRLGRPLLSMLENGLRTGFGIPDEADPEMDGTESDVVHLPHPVTRNEKEDLANRIRIRENLDRSAFGRSLSFLRDEILRGDPELQTTLFVLPVNRFVYHAAGLNPDLMEERMLSSMRRILPGAKVEILFMNELKDPSLFYDIVHVNAMGRERIARRILQSMKQNR